MPAEITMSHEITPSQPRGLTPYEQGRPAATSPEPLATQRGYVEELWDLTRRNLWIIAGCLTISILLAVIYNSRATPIYQSSTRVRVEKSSGGGGTGKEPALSILGVASGDDLETEMAVIQSTEFMARVVERLALELQVLPGAPYARDQVFSRIAVSTDARIGQYILSRQRTGAFALQDLHGARLAEVAPGEPLSIRGFGFTLAPEAARFRQIHFEVLPRDAAVGRAIGGLQVQRAGPQISIVSVGYRSTDRGLAASVPNTTAQVFLERRRAIHSTKARNMAGFLEEQIATLGPQLRQAEDRLRSYQEARSTIAPLAEGQTGIGQVASLVGSRDALEAERRSLGKLLNEVETAPPANPLEPSPYRKLVAFPSLISLASSSALLGTLISLENERAQLLTRRTPEDPDVEALTERITTIEGQLHAIASTYYSALNSQASSFESSIGRERGQLSQLPEKMVEIMRRQREVELLQQVYVLLQTRLKEAEIAEAVEDPGAYVIDKATTPGGPILPRKRWNLMLAVFFGTLAGYGLAALRGRFDRSVRTKEEVRLLTGAPVLGLIPRFEGAPPSLNGSWMRRLLPGRNGGGSPRRYLTSTLDPRHAVAEAFRSLRTNITFTNPERQPRTLLLTSALPEDGKTTTAVNLTHAFALQGLRVLLIDGDMRRGMINEFLGLPRDPGLSTVLLKDTDVDSVIREVQLDSGLHFDVITSGHASYYPSELLGSTRLQALLEDLSKRYDQIVIDTPPLSLVTDAAVLSRHVDSVLLVVRMGHTNESALELAAEQLRHVNAPLRGTILNDIDPKDRGYGYPSYAARYYHAG